MKRESVTCTLSKLVLPCKEQIITKAMTKANRWVLAKHLKSHPYTYCNKRRTMQVTFFFIDYKLYINDIVHAYYDNYYWKKVCGHRHTHTHTHTHTYSYIAYLLMWGSLMLAPMIITEYRVIAHVCSHYTLTWNSCSTIKRALNAGKCFTRGSGTLDNQVGAVGFRATGN